MIMIINSQNEFPSSVLVTSNHKILLSPIMVIRNKNQLLSSTMTGNRLPVTNAILIIYNGYS